MSDDKLVQIGQKIDNGDEITLDEFGTILHSNARQLEKQLTEGEEDGDE